MSMTAFSGRTRDDHAWAFAQAEALRAKDHASIDAEGVARALERLAARERRELRRRVVILLCHLMEWERVPDLRGKPWAAVIEEQRRAIGRLLTDSPSLRPTLDDLLRATHGAATRRAALETGYPRDHFPWAPTYSVEQVLDDAFWPDLG